jgi:O-antigen/teichoic acid export membrane protein
MLKKIMHFGRHTVIYGMGSALNAIGSFLLIPLYTNILTTEEYGILELLNRTGEILLLFIMLGVRQAFIRFYFDHEDDQWRKKVLATTLLFLLTTSTIAILIFNPLKEMVADLLFDDPLIGALFLYVILWIPFDLVVNVGLAHLQIQLKSIKYVVINFFKFFFYLGSNVLLVYYYRMGIEGILITNLWIAAVLGLSFLAYYAKWTHFKVSLQLLKDMLKFGLPYLPTAFFGYIIHNGDRYFLTIYSNLDELGIYALGFKIGMFGLAFIVEPFGRVWTPFLFENYNKKDGPELISKVFTIYTVIVVTVALGISVSAPTIIPLISDKAFYASFKIIPVICLGAVFYDLAIMADAGILIKKKTKYKPLIFGSAAIVAIISNLIFVPLLESLGAAIAMVFTFLSLFIVNFSISNRFYKIDLEYRKMIVIIVGAIIVYLISKFILDTNPEDMTTKIVSISTFGLYPVILWFGGLLTKKEKELLLKLRKRDEPLE